MTERARGGLRVQVMVLLLVAALLLQAVPAAAANLAGTYCTPGARDTVISGMGVPFESELTQRVVIPSYFQDCGRPNNQLIYRSDPPDAIYNSLVYRDDLFWGMVQPLTTSQKLQIEGDTGTLSGSPSPLEEIPLMVYSVGMAYNLPCLSVPLNLTSAQLSLLLLGVITHWNDPRLLSGNPGLLSCGLSVQFCARADDSDDTHLVKDYLSKRNPAWQYYLDPARSRSWPSPPARLGLGSDGEAACVGTQFGALGYVETRTARLAGLTLANVENASTLTVAPTPDQLTLAANVGASPPTTLADWSHTSITDGPAGYPISAFVYVLAFEYPSTAAPLGKTVTLRQVALLRDLLLTAVGTNAQAALAPLFWGPLPTRVQTVAHAGADQIDYGAPII